MSSSRERQENEDLAERQNRNFAQPIARSTTPSRSILSSAGTSSSLPGLADANHISMRPGTGGSVLIE